MVCTVQSDTWQYKWLIFEEDKGITVKINKWFNGAIFCHTSSYSRDRSQAVNSQTQDPCVVWKRRRREEYLQCSPGPCPVKWQHEGGNTKQPNQLLVSESINKQACILLQHFRNHTCLTDWKPERHDLYVFARSAAQVAAVAQRIWIEPWQLIPQSHTL